MQLVNPTLSKGSKGQDCVALNLLGDLASPSDLQGEVLSPSTSQQEETLKVVISRNSVTIHDHDNC